MTHEQILSNTRLREQSILRNVYLWMTLGLGLTGVISLGMASNRVMIQAFASNPVLFFGAIIGEFALVIYLSTRLMKMSATAATLGFAGYAALNGLTLSVIFLAYTGQSIAQAFFVAGGTLRRHESLGHGHEAGSLFHRQLSLHGAYRSHHRFGGQPLLPF